MIKEGAVNTYKNKLMSLASICIVSASLVIFGIFFLISLNISANMKIFGEQPEVVVFCEPDMDEAQASLVGEKISDLDEVSSVRMVTRKEYFETVKEMFEGNTGLLENLDETFLPVKFNLMLGDYEKCDDIEESLKNIDGVWDVQYPKKVVEFIRSISYWLRFLSILLIIVLLLIATFIMENTIKLTVHAREKEISIMQYIGATDGYIRWPFIVEGVIIGFAGAIIAYAFVAYGYTIIADSFNNDILQIGIEFIRLIDIRDISFLLVLLFIMMGTLVGAMGSWMSIRKYLKV